ncbi:MAG: hypothetical protein EOM25_05120 [Deltaproteobacteria bacterium]|nr:hypothetical protein [Deltaproteobacteria bacterium]
MNEQKGPLRPDGIAYWIDERPPPGMSIMVAVQQLAFLGAIMTLPVAAGPFAVFVGLLAGQF